jgi:hypothetical protein
VIIPSVQYCFALNEKVMLIVSPCSGLLVDLQSYAVFIQ